MNRESPNANAPVAGSHWRRGPAMFALIRAEWSRQRRRALWPMLLGLFLFGATLSLLLQVELYAAFEDRLRAQAGTRGFHEIVTTVATSVAAWLGMLVTTAAAATTLSAERTSAGMLPVLASPFTSAEIVLGKFLGLMALPITALALYAVELFAMSLFLPLDRGQVSAALCALVMLWALACALGLVCAIMFREGASALLGSLVVLATMAFSPIDTAGWGFVAQLIAPLRGGLGGVISASALTGTALLLAGLLGAAGLWLEAERYPR